MFIFHLLDWIHNKHKTLQMKDECVHMVMLHHPQKSAYEANKGLRSDNKYHLSEQNDGSRYLEHIELPGACFINMGWL